MDSILIFSNISGYPIGVFLLQKKIPVKLIILGAATFSLSGIIIASYTTNWTAFCLAYGLMNGLGAGTCYMIPLMIAWEYFPHRRGLVTGIIDGAYGMGAFSYTLLS
jgi:OFA family oxalate/formate antiporter-like MFS transporter